MSEKIYVLLLRLYPSDFRETYGAEALQLFRDRSRDEKGFIARIRLWCDLLLDLLISVPREYRYARHVLAGASAYHHGGVPSFYFLKDESPRPGALLFGGALSMAVLCAISIGIGQVGKYGSGRRMWPETSPPTSGIGTGLLSALRTNPAQQNPAGISATLDSAERNHVIEAAVADLKQYYFDPTIAQKMADSLLSRERRGDYNAVSDRDVFADLLTTQLRVVSDDSHLIVAYSSMPVAEQSPELAAERFAGYRRTMEHSNCTLEKVKILSHNIGYLKLNSFPDPSICQSTVTAAMASLNGTEAVIFDLRDNTGGFPNMVSLIAAYLFDHPEYMYNPRENTTQLSWTKSPVPGNRLADKPVYILTSARTFSGAEQFSYDLKMLKRATLVGETTRGVPAHAGTYHRIDDHFGIGITEVRAINPFSQHDWDGIGVEPDVKVKAANALETAQRLAENKLQKK